jgi:anti-sigma regulatory factor (Ser/Thr protein kinase)
VGQSRAMAVRVVLELPRTRQAPRMARQWLAESFAGRLDAREQETTKLLVSELVTNAVVHGRGRIELRAELDQDRLLVEVIDEGPGFAGADFHALCGHGLWIVGAEASRWGIWEGTANTWFELRRGQAALTAT